MVLALVVVVLGIAAGSLTSLAGQGGGLFLVIACSVLFGPHAALAMTAPALMVGNVHRAWLHRPSIDRPIAARMAAGALPGALCGGFLAGALPASALNVVLVATTAIAIAKATGRLRFAVPRGALAPAAFAIGVMTGTAGGAGILLAPVLLAAGLSGASYVATVSVVAVVMHLGRVVAYGSAGLFSSGTADLVERALVLAVSIAIGNAIATRLRARLSKAATTRLEYGTLVVCVTLSVLGLR